MLDPVKTTKLVLDKNERIAELEEENKFLKSEIELLKKTRFSDRYLKKLEEENKKLKEERDFFKEQAILWRKDWKVAYEENIKLKERIKELETDYDRLKVAFEDVVSWK